MSKVLSPVKVFLQRLIFKPNGVCPICGKLLFRTDSYICEPCSTELPIISETACRYCGRPLEKPHLRNYCKDCGAMADPVLDGGMVWMHYHGGGKKMVQSLKFGHRPQLGIWMGERMAEEILIQRFKHNIDVVVPVPLHTNRMEERGYNQSDYLAKGIAGYLGLRVFTDNLQRIVDTPHQIGKSREERLVNLKNAFSVKDPEGLSGKVVLLVDDVITTGSTLRACAIALKGAGAHVVYTAAAAGVK